MTGHFRSIRVSADIRKRSNALLVETLERRSLLSATISNSITDETISPTAGVQSIDLSQYFSGAALPDNAYELDTTLGVIPLELTPSIAPLTVANFLSYVSEGAYSNTVVNQVIPNSVWTSGGFKYSTATGGFVETPTDAPVQNEYSSPNVEGSIALAKTVAGTSDGTDQFFFNLTDNSTPLSTLNGGYTVFGNVMGDAGLAVMHAIGEAATTNDTKDSTGNFTNVPVLNTLAGLTQDNYLYIDDVKADSSPYSVYSDNDSVVKAVVSGNDLTLTPVADGTAHITIAAVGADGVAVSQSFTATVQVPVTPVSIGAGAGVASARYRDSAGAVVTVKVGGTAESATVELTGESITVSRQGFVAVVSGDNVGLNSITVFGGTSTKRSTGTLQVTSTKGAVDVVTIDSPDLLRSLTAPSVNLIGSSSLTSVDNVTLGGLGVGASLNVTTVSRLQFTGSADGTIEATNTIQSLVFKKAWAGALQASSVGAISATDASATLDVTGNISKLVLSGTFSGTISAGSTTKFSSKSISNASISFLDFNNALGALSTKLLKNSSIVSAGNIGTINVSSPISGSTILAGVASSVTNPTPLDAAKGDGGSGAIGLLKISGSMHANAIQDSAIGATELIDVQISNISDMTSSALFYGIAAHKIDQMNTRIDDKILKLKNVLSAQSLAVELQVAKIALANVKLELI